MLSYTEIVFIYLILYNEPIQDDNVWVQSIKDITLAHVKWVFSPVILGKISDITESDHSILLPNVITFLAHGQAKKLKTWIDSLTFKASELLHFITDGLAHDS